MSYPSEYEDIYDEDFLFLEESYEDYDEETEEIEENEENSSNAEKSFNKYFETPDYFFHEGKQRDQTIATNGETLSDTSKVETDDARYMN